MGLKQVIARLVSGKPAALRVRPNEVEQKVGYDEDDEEFIIPSVNRTPIQVENYITSLAATLDSMETSEHALRHANMMFTAKFFEEDRDPDFKHALVFFLTKRFPRRNDLWEAMIQRNASVLHLL